MKRKTLLLFFGFFFFIIKVFRFQRKTLLLFFGLFFFIIIISFFLTRFLRNVWTDFHEIFRDGVYWFSLAEISFSSDDVTSGPRYWRFPDFEVVILWRIHLRNDSRYLFQIYMDDRQRTELYSMWSASLLVKKRRSAVGLEYRVWNSVRLFRCFSAITLIHKYFVITYITKVV